MNDDKETQGAEPTLSDADKAALDARFDASGDQADADRSRTLDDLLALLATPVADESEKHTRIDITQLAARSDAPVLTAASRDSVDAFVSGDNPDDEHDQRHAALAAAVTSGAPYSDEQRSELVNRTLDAIQSDIDREQSRRVLDFPVIPGGGLRLADVISVAAMLLLAASVVVPVLSGMRANSFRAECNTHLAGVSRSMGMYAGSNGDTLPMATAGFGGTWMDVGSTPDRSNSSNLFRLVKTSYASLEDLACPTNPNALVDADVETMHDWRSLEEISYSYRIMGQRGLRAHEVDEPRRVVLLADRSPVILRIASRSPVLPEENTPNHDSRGQHILRLDGSTQWTATPILEQGDNLWLPRHIERVVYDARDKLGVIQGNEMPQGPHDAFVAP